MDMQARDYQKEAMRAAKRGDTAKLDEIELAYVQAHVVLFDPDRIYEDDEGLIRGHAVRVVRGAGTDGRTIVQWATTDGGYMWSEKRRTRATAGALCRHRDSVPGHVGGAHAARQYPQDDANPVRSYRAWRTPLHRDASSRISSGGCPSPPARWRRPATYLGAALVGAVLYFSFVVGVTGL